MASELQSLLEKIQTEGVEKAEAQAASIVAAAEQTAAEKVAAAERAAAALLQQAEAEAAVLQVRAEQAVRQAARDVVLGVGQSVRETLERVLLGEVRAALSGDFLTSFLEALVRGFASSPEVVGGIEVLVAPEQVERLVAFAQQRLTDAVKGGLKISPNRDVQAGIRVMLSGGRIEHDFTDEAIEAAMSQMMRPALTKMVFGTEK